MARETAVGLVALALIGVCAYKVRRCTPAGFTITNESGRPIPFVTVEVADAAFHCKDVPGGVSVSGSFQVRQGESLRVRARLSGGAEINEHCGYVVWEEFAPQIAVTVGPESSVIEHPR